MSEFRLVEFPQANGRLCKCLIAKRGSFNSFLSPLKGMWDQTESKLNEIGQWVTKPTTPIYIATNHNERWIKMHILRKRHIHWTLWMDHALKWEVVIRTWDTTKPLKETNCADSQATINTLNHVVLASRIKNNSNVQCIRQTINQT